MRPRQPTPAQPAVVRCRPIGYQARMTTAQPPAAAAPRLASVLTLTTAAQAFGTMCVLWLSALAPKLGGDLGIPTSFIAYQISLIYFGGMLTSLLGGALVRRLGAGTTTQLSIVFACAGALLISAASLPAMAAGSLCLGAAYGLTNPAAAHLLTRVVSDRNRNIVFSIKQSGVPLGGILAGLIAPSLALALGWRASLLLLPLVGLAMIALLAPVAPVWNRDRDPTARVAGNLLAGLRVVWRQRTLRCLSLATYCLSGVQMTATTFTVAMLVEQFGWHIVLAGVVLSVLQGCGVGGRLIWGVLADMTGQSMLVLLALIAVMVASAGGLVLLTAQSPAWAVWAALIAYGMTGVSWTGLLMAEISRVAGPRLAADAMGGTLVFTFGGVMTGPAIFAMVHGQLGAYTLAFAYPMALAGVAGILVALARRPAPPP